MTKVPPSSQGKAGKDAAAGQKRKASDAVDVGKQSAKGEKRAKTQNDLKKGLVAPEKNSSSTNQNKKSNIPAT